MTIVYNAISNHDAEFIKSHFNSCGNIYSVEDIRNYLMYCLHWYNFDVSQEDNDRMRDIIKLFASKCGVNWIDKRSDRTPLSHCCANGTTTAVKILLECGADVNGSNLSGRTALMYASGSRAESAPEMVSDLLKYRANVNAKDEFGANALIYCCVNSGNPDVAKLLLDHGSDIDCTTVQNCYGQAIKEGDTAFLLACRKNNPDLIELLCQYGANIFAENKAGYGALSKAYCAPGKPSLQTMEVLIHKGLDINSSMCGNNKTILEDSIINYKSKKEVFEFLIQNGADINRHGKYGRTPLHHAAACLSLKPVQKLVKVGADINSKDNNGNVPLNYLFISREWYGSNHFSSDVLNAKESKKAISISNYMVKHGADPFIQDDSGACMIDIDNLKNTDGTPHRDTLIQLRHEYLAKHIPCESVDIPDREW